MTTHVDDSRLDVAGKPAEEEEDVEIAEDIVDDDEDDDELDDEDDEDDEDPEVSTRGARKDDNARTTADE